MFSALDILERFFVVVVVVSYCHLQVATTEEGLEYVGVGGK